MPLISIAGPGSRLRVSQAAPDTTPNQFTFTDQTGVALSSAITGAAITVSGLGSGQVAPVTVSGGTADINSSGTFSTSPGNVANGDTVRPRVMSSGSNSTAVSAVITIGGVSDTFTATTLSASGLTDISLLALHQDFESTGLSLGQIMTTGGIMDGTVAVLDNTFNYSGTRSGKVHAEQGSENTFEFGFYYDLATYLGYKPVKGDEIWIRFRSRMPAGGSWASSTGLKWLRVSTETNASGNLGAVYSVLDPSGRWVGIYEGTAMSYQNYTASTSHAPQVGVWETYEFYVKLDNAAAPWRFWKNGTLVGEITAYPSLASATARAFSVAWCTYWNGGEPGGSGDYPTVDQDWQIDDIAIAVKAAGHRDDTPHLATDLNGYLYIGM